MAIDKITQSTIDSYGVLTVPDLPFNSVLKLRASYTSNNSMAVNTKIIAVNNDYYLTSVSIDGSSTVSDRSSTQYSCVAHYSDNSTATVSAVWSLSNNSIGATLNNNGLLTLPDLSGNGSVTINVSYTQSGVTHTALLDITVSNNYKVNSIAINGGNSQNDYSTVQYTCTVTMSDSTTKTVVPVYSLTGNTSGCTIDTNGNLTIPDVGDGKSVTINVSYTENGTTVTNSKLITITNNYHLPSSLTINGSASTNDNTTSSYTCAVTYADGTSSSAVPTWSLTNNSSGCTINSSGVLTIPDISANGTVTINAAYTENSTTVITSFNVNLFNTYVAVSGKGYWGGGGSVSNEIDGINFVTEVSINPSVALTVARNCLAGVSSIAKGYWGGGYTGYGDTNEIDGINFSTEASINPSATLVVARRELTSSYSSSKGYFFGGYAMSGYTLKNEIDGINFSTEASINPSAVLSILREYSTSVQSSTKGYVVCGSNTGGHVSTTEGFYFASESINTLYYSSISGADGRAGVNSPTKGYVGGGYINGNFQNIGSIDNIKFSDETVSRLSATISSRAFLSGTSSVIKGYWGGGNAKNWSNIWPMNTIESIDFSTEAVVSQSAKLAIARDYLASVQSSS